MNRVGPQLVTTLAASAALLFAPVASAHPAPAEDPCAGVPFILCHFIPMAPELDDDIDLTGQSPPGEPSLRASPPSPSGR